MKKVLLEVSQNSQEKIPVLESPLIKVAGFAGSAALFKKRPQHRFFPVEFAKLLRTSQKQPPETFFVGSAVSP